MNHAEIQVKIKGEIATIFLNRPDKMNALTPTLIKEWKEALITIAANTACKVVIVTGNGRAWSAGVDLAVFQEIKIEKGNEMYEDGLEIMKLLETMPQVTIAMINGYTFTGAMELMMAFDLIIADEDAKIGDTHAKWGIPPKWGMTQRLQHQVGMRKAKELSFTCQPISGKEAERIGLVNKAVSSSELKSTVDTMVRQILANSSQTIKAIKTLYHYSSTHSLPEGLEFERDFQLEITDKEENLKNFKKEI